MSWVWVNVVSKKGIEKNDKLKKMEKINTKKL